MTLSNKSNILSHIVAVACIAMLGLTSCHTTEENYKASYDIAAEKARKGLGEETYSKIVAEQNKNTDVVNGDSVKILHRHVGYVDIKREETKVYNVVVAQFKQRTNARAMCKRLKAQGHNSYVLFSSTDALNMVVVEGFDTVEEAADFIKNAVKKIKMKVNLDKLCILKRLY